MNTRPVQPSGRRPAISICIALIHNNNEVRNSLIRPNIEELCEFLGATCEVRSIEVSYQPEIKPLPPQLTLERKRIAHQLTRDWAVYRGLAPAAEDEPQSVSAEEQRAGAVEMVLTDKHVRAWGGFLDLPCDFLVCFEDDAIFRHTSETRLLAVLERAKALGEDTNLYVDLAGGCVLPALGVGQLVERVENDLVHFRKPVTNTACGYMLNRAMAADFMDLLIYQPAFRYTPADWLMNRLLIEVERRGRHSACFHLEPTVFEHGSIKGIWASSRG